MTLDRTKYTKFLVKAAEAIDISPTAYRKAVEHYEAVGHWLEIHYEGCKDELSIYPQGSFRLGTVVRPIKNNAEADYDIDLVSEIPIAKDQTNPRTVKTSVGDCLRKNGDYAQKLDKEGRRCWTLEYAEQNGVGFHLDILPCVPEQGAKDGPIAITDKLEDEYGWSASNPKGYAEWFEGKNSKAFESAQLIQKQALMQREPNIYQSVEDVPDQLVRTPLQRAIQLMKRHRDVWFGRPSRNSEHAPISIIITTLTANFYSGEEDVLSVLESFVKFVRQALRRRSDGEWYIANPVNSKENFADRWNEDNGERADAFWAWVSALEADLLNALIESKEVAQKRLRVALCLPSTAAFWGLVVSATAAGNFNRPRKVNIENPARPWRSNGMHDLLVDPRQGGQFFEPWKNRRTYGRLAGQIRELHNEYGVLSVEREKGGHTRLYASLCFHAFFEGFETVEDTFNIKLLVPQNYPESLPRVWETEGRITSAYQHVYNDRSLCLGIASDLQQKFSENPTLLGFVDNLVIPYLCGYQHWIITGTNPIGEQPHGVWWIDDYYFQRFGLNDRLKIMDTICYLLEHGVHKGGHLCPCGSGQRIKNCHEEELRESQREKTIFVLTEEFRHLRNEILERKQSLPKGFVNRVEHIWKKIRNGGKFRS